MLRYGGLVLLLLWPVQAAAHAGAGPGGGFVAGFAHPISGIDHLLAMVSVGIWGHILRRPLLIVLPIVFPAMMAMGGLAGIAGLPAPPVELGIALSVIVLGGAIAATWRAPVPVAILLVGGFALFHGYAHGRELPAAADPLYYSVGFMLATGLLHLAGIGIGTIRDTRHGPALTGALGGGIALAGLWFLNQAIR